MEADYKTMKQLGFQVLWSEINKLEILVELPKLISQNKYSSGFLKYIHLYRKKTGRNSKYRSKAKPNTTLANSDTWSYTYADFSHIKFTATCNLWRRFELSDPKTA